MKWQKLGRIFDPVSDVTENHPLLHSHASNPTPIHLEGDNYRILYSGRDKQNRSSVGFFDFNLKTFELYNTHHPPLFTFGSEGSFYESGVSLGGSYKIRDRTYILFMGWQNPPNEHWRGDIGKLELTKDFKLILSSKQPVLPLSDTDPISFSYPWVYETESNYYMVYGSTKTWSSPNGEMIHVLNLAESKDGICWNKRGLCLPYKENHAQAFSRPTVYIDHKKNHHMWFSYRSGTGETYRIGYAYKNPNDAYWQLDLNKAGISISPSGWDSEMIEYPYVFSHNGGVYMLYNGNDFGKTGIGLAVLKLE